MPIENVVWQTAELVIGQSKWNPICSGKFAVQNETTCRDDEARRLQTCIRDLISVQAALQGVEQLIEQPEGDEMNRLIAERDELARDLKAMTDLQVLSARLLTKTELQPLLEETLDATMALQSADFGYIQLYHARTKSLEIVAHRGFNRRFLDYFANVADERTVCGRAMKRQQRVIVEDILTDPAFEQYRAVAACAGFRTVQSTPLFSGNGELLGMISTHFRKPHHPLDRELRLSDLYAQQAAGLIERKRTEEALRTSELALQKLQSELAYVTRLTTMGELAASIAHEINQPLGAIVNNGNLCLRLLGPQAGISKEIHDALSDIVEDANRANAIIVRVRAMTKHTLSEKTLLRLPAVIADVIVLARRELDKNGVDVRTEFSEDVPSVSGDRVQLQQVFLNLVMNGIEAMAGIARAQRKLAISGTRCEWNGRLFALITVHDTGAGFSPELEHKVFEAFYTTKPQGMGMGLSISRTIVEAHGGRLWAKSMKGEGTTFSCLLPIEVPKKV